MKAIDVEIARMDKVLVAMGCVDMYSISTWAGDDNYVMVASLANGTVIECNYLPDGHWLYRVEFENDACLKFLSFVDAVAVAEAERVGFNADLVLPKSNDEA